MTIQSVFRDDCEVVRFPNDAVYDRERFFERMDSLRFEGKRFVTR